MAILFLKRHRYSRLRRARFLYVKRQSVREVDTYVGVDNVVTPLKRCKVKTVCAKQTIFEFIERTPAGERFQEPSPCA